MTNEELAYLFLGKDVLGAAGLVAEARELERIDICKKLREYSLEIEQEDEIMAIGVELAINKLLLE